MSDQIRQGADATPSNIQAGHSAPPPTAGNPEIEKTLATIPLASGGQYGIGCGLALLLLFVIAVALANISFLGTQASTTFSTVGDPITRKN